MTDTLYTDFPYHFGSDGLTSRGMGMGGGEYPECRFADGLRAGGANRPRPDTREEGSHSTERLYVDHITTMTVA